MFVSITMLQKQCLLSLFHMLYFKNNIPYLNYDEVHPLLTIQLRNLVETMID